MSATLDTYAHKGESMALNYPSQGESSAAIYQISATPFVTSSTVALGDIAEVQFGYISRFIVVKNTSDSGVLSVSFTKNGLKPTNSNYFVLSGSEAFSADMRTDRLFVSGSGGATCNFTVIGGLTTVPSKYMTAITASNLVPGVG
jgi:hypothetical protein